MRNAPSMTGLRVLEAVVRTGSLSAAARELCVTAAAVSHRLRDLETRSGAPLVHRVGRRFEATETGRAIIETLGDAFQRIRQADALLQGGRARELRIAASYSFAVLWLMPRVPLLERQFPDTDLMIHPTHAPLADGLSDVTIVHAARRPEGPGWTLLFEDRCAAIGRADHAFFATGQGRLQDVLDCRLVHIAHEKGPEWGEFRWQDWAAKQGLVWSGPRKRRLSVSAEHLAADMLLASDALALISVINASDLLASGRFRAVPGSETPSGCSYWISCREASGPGSARAQRIRDWMIATLRA